MNVLAKVVYGSGLYGTSIPTSDVDYRGVYLPSKEDCFLNRIKDTITDPKEEDTQYYSLQYFLKMAAQGQSVAIELLAAPIHHHVVLDLIWDALRNERRRFYTKSMHAFLGFAKSMASKYSSRVDRLKETEDILKVLSEEKNYEDSTVGFVFPPGLKLGMIWDKLPESTNAIKTINLANAGADKRVYQVCGRELQVTMSLENVSVAIENICESYGERVRKAAVGDLDWKSVAHAFRVALQAKEIVETGDLVYPLKDAEYLRNMRLGKFDFVKENLDQKLDELINEVQTKMNESNLPEKADTKWCDKFVLDVYASMA